MPSTICCMLCHTNVGNVMLGLIHRLGHLPTATTATHQQHCVWRCTQSVCGSELPRQTTAVFSHIKIARCVRQGVETAVATVCPAVRNRRQGMPACVLEYADLIPANAGERAALKPLLLAGAQHLQTNSFPELRAT